MTSNTQSFLRIRALVAAALAATMLAGCGGGDAPPPDDPLSAFTRQKLDWRACDLAFLGEKRWQSAQDDFTQLGERAQCALMRAPLDYANPALGELQVALSRVTAKQPQRRMGAILFNPGGPGGDGLLLGATYGQAWSEADPQTPASQQLNEMSNRYDLIGFSPRGVGAGTPLDCGAAIFPEVDSYSFHDRSPQNLRDLQNATRLQAQACIDNPLSQHIHTDATARDMDLVRGLIGDDKLNYIGYSYGTWLGAWYASLFPARVGRMLLDSSTNITDSFDGIYQLQEMGKQRLLDEVFLPYATRHPQIFNLGDSPAQLRSQLVALSSKLKSILFFDDEDDDVGLTPIKWTDAEGIDDSLFYINAALGLQTLLTQQPAADEQQLHAAITTHRFAPNKGLNAIAVENAHRLASKLFAKPGSSPKSYSLEEAVNMSVRCNDTGTSGNAQRWIDIGNEYATRYPLTGGSSTANPCLYWPKPAIERPPVAMAAKAGPLLMLQSRFDGLTPIEGAQATLAALPNASMIVVENESGHGLFPYGEDCVDGQVANYFLHGTMPPRLSSCTGKPLEFDAPRP